MHGDTASTHTHRRPIAARRVGLFQRLADRLAAAGVSANVVSVVGLGLGMLAGLSLAATRWLDDAVALQRAAWLAGAVLVQGRLLCNLLDGLVAQRRGGGTRLGELMNEAPDRAADVAVLVGLGFAVGGEPAWGWAAATAALATAYVRAVGRSLGQASDFCGPMAKQQRMFAVTVAAVVAGVAPGWAEDVELAKWVLLGVAVGAALTAVRRLVRLVRDVRSGPAVRREGVADDHA